MVKNKYPLDIMWALRQHLGLGKDDTSLDASINRTPHNVVLDRVSAHNGLYDYGGTIRGWVKDIYGINLEEL